MRDYWLGVLTLPALALAGWGLFWAWFWAVMLLDSEFGISFEAKWKRGEGVSDFLLRHDIWWERSFGPVFIGGWYREPPRYPADAPTLRLFNRWVGIGRADGPCVMAFKKRDLTTPAPHDSDQRPAGGAGEG